MTVLTGNGNAKIKGSENHLIALTAKIQDAAKLRVSQLKQRKYVTYKQSENSLFSLKKQTNFQLNS